MEEEKKYGTIKRLVEEDGNKNRAAMTLGITRRQVNRLLKKYQEAGKAPKRSRGERSLHRPDPA